MKPAGQEHFHTSAGGAEIHGYCDSRFERVLETFKENFEARDEIGASCCVTFEGETVVDLWGGHTTNDKTDPWTDKTISVVFSSTKGAAALCAHILVSRGELDLDAPIAEYWPEFACNGKENALVGMTLDHSVGVPVVRDPIGDVTNWDAMAERMAAEEAFWEPGTRNGYHGLTYSWTIGEIIRRVSGMSVGAFFQKEVAAPLGLDFWIGLPEAYEDRVAIMYPNLPKASDPQSLFLKTALSQPQSPAALFVFNSGSTDMNSREYRAAEIPAGNGMANGRSLAHMYKPLALGGGDLVDAKTLARMGRVSMATRQDATLMLPSRFALGFMKSMDNRKLKTTPPTDSAIMGDAAFGHVGMGGSIGFADPEAGLSFGYNMNNMGLGILLNERGQSLVDAAYLCAGYTSNESGAWRR